MLARTARETTVMTDTQPMRYLAGALSVGPYLGNNRCALGFPSKCSASSQGLSLSVISATNLAMRPVTIPDQSINLEFSVLTRCANA